ncbi:MAG: YIP1 family protein [Firmicutes bacterium]|nr:YIP1 family protein [Bacillota bacterium]
MENSMVRDNLKQLNFFTRITNLFTSPNAVFDSLLKKPDFIWPVIFITITSLINVPITEYINKIAIQSYPKYAEILNSQPQTPMLVSILIGFVSLIALWFIGSLVYWGIAAISGGKSAGFRQILSIIGYTYITMALQMIFQGSIYFTTGILPPTGLEAGMDLTSRFFSPLGIFLSMINPFNIASIILTIVALGKAFQISRTKATVITLIFWIVFVGIAVIGSIFSSRTLLIL